MSTPCERIIPGQIGIDLYNEHISRYLFTKQFIKNKKVLDLGCGTGYGTKVMAKDAGKVVGVDISWSAINHAKKHFSTKKISFHVEDCLKLGLANESFDVVVSFEVIEHIKDYTELLKEAKRVLRNDGIFILSTPNKRYTEEKGETNPYHIHEFYYNEFVNLLKEFFGHVQILAENHCHGISISSPQCKKGYVHFPAHVNAPAKDTFFKTPSYFIAVCYQNVKSVPEMKRMFYVPSEANILREKERHIKALQEQLKEFDNRTAWAIKSDEELKEKSIWAKKIDDELQKKNKYLTQLQHDFDEHSKYIEKLLKDLEERNHALQKLQHEFDERSKWALKLDAELKERDSHLRKLQQEFEEKTEWASQLNSELKKKDEYITSLQSDFDKKSTWASELDAGLKEKEAYLAKLQQEFEEKALWASQLNTDLKEKDKHILHLRYELEEKTALAVKLHEEIERQNSSHITLNQLLQEKDLTIVELQEDIKKKSNAVSKLQKELGAIKNAKIFKLGKKMGLIKTILF